VTIPKRNSNRVLDCRYDTRDPDVWYLLHDWRRDVSVDGTNVPVQIAAGFAWDSASVPKRLRSIVNQWGEHSTAALVHDWLYVKQPVDRETADRAFLVALKEDGVGWIKRNTMYLAVRAFGGPLWRD